MSYDSKKKNLIYNVGIVTNDDIISENGKSLKSYITWRAMIHRCYSIYNGDFSYRDCSVCDEWLYYANFKKWFDENYHEGYHLDKDILKEHNKVYSPETCCFVPPLLNMMIVTKQRKKSTFPTGVSLQSNGKYQVIVKLNGRPKRIGNQYDTIEEAHSAYICFKRAHVMEVVERFYNEGLISKDVYNALLNRTWND